VNVDSGGGFPHAKPPPAYAGAGGEGVEDEFSGRCAAILSNGKRCPNAALPGTRYCGVAGHQELANRPEVPAEAPEDAPVVATEQEAEELEPVARVEEDASAPEPEEVPSDEPRESVEPSAQPPATGGVPEESAERATGVAETTSAEPAAVPAESDEEDRPAPAA
jgi:hypothetical protein